MWEDGLLIHKTGDKGAVAENLQARATRMLLETSQGGLAFHAAGLSAGDRAVILPAQSGSGKNHPLRLAGRPGLFLPVR